MLFKILTKEEFNDYAKNHEQGTFHQHSSWGELKAKTNWESHFLGISNKDGKLLGASLILSKKLFLNYKIFYAPRGFLINYHDFDLLSFFTNEVKKYVKKNSGIFLKIDPNVVYLSHDIDGKITDEINNEIVIDNLKKLGYKHFGFNLNYETVQPRWAFYKNLKVEKKEELALDLKRYNKKVIKTNQENYITTRFIEYDEISIFKDIMSHTSERRSFIDRPLSYYQDMYKILSKYGMIKISIAEINFKKMHSNTLEKIEDLQRKKDATTKIKKNENKLNEYDNQIRKLNEALESCNSSMKKHGDSTVLGGIMFIISNNEILSLFGGNYEEFHNYNAPYTVNWNMIEYGYDHGYDRYNFYGISGDFNPDHELYGLFLFKKAFGGVVEELIGEFDLVINKTMFLLYNLAYKAYNLLKRIKLKIKS